MHSFSWCSHDDCNIAREMFDRAQSEDVYFGQVLNVRTISRTPELL